MSTVNKSIRSKKLKHASAYSEKERYLKILKVVVLVGLLFVIFYTPYLRGLYFEPEQFITQIALFSLFTLFWMYKWFKNDKVFLRTTIDYAAFGLTIIYILTSFTAVSQRLAVSEFLKYAMYFVVFLMLSDLIKTDKEKAIVLWVIVSSALGVCVIGIDSASGGKIVDLLNNLFKALNFNIEFFGLFVNGRMHSTMQYPNALASYLMALFFVTVSLTMTSSKWIKSLASAISFVLLTTFIFTISRGAYILLVFAGITFLMLLPKESKLKGLYNLLTVAIITLGSSLILSKFISAESANKIYIWPIIIAGALLSFSIRFTDDHAIRVLNKINWKIALIVATALVGASVCTIPYIYNSSVPLELEHSMNEKESYKGVSKLVSLNSNKTYKLVFNADGQLINDKASYAYRIYILGVKKSGTAISNGDVIINEQYKSTVGIEEKEVEFTVPESSDMVSIYFQSYYPGTSVKFYNAKIYDAENGKEVKDLILKHKYPFAESILSRFVNISSDTSLNTRITILEDGLKMFKDRWLIGAGGGAWSILNFKYQSFLYWSTQTHNYPLQVLIETGLIGFIILGMLFISIVVCFIKLFKKNNSENENSSIVNSALFTAIVFLFIHSALDFDFSLSSIYLLVWELIALLNTDVRKDVVNVHVGGKNRKTKGSNVDFKVFTEGIKNRFKKGINAYPAIVIILTCVVMIYPIKFYTAYNYSNKALNSINANKLEEAIKLIEKATDLDNLKTEFVTGYAPISSKPDIRLGYIDLVIRKLKNDSKQNGEGIKDSTDLNDYIVKAQELAKRAQRHAKYNSDLSLNLGLYYLNTSEKDKGIDFINRSLDLKPMVPTQWYYKANTNYSVAISYLNQGDREKGLEYIDNTLRMIDEAKTVNKSNLVPFVFSKETQEFIEKAYYTKYNKEGRDASIGNLVFQSIFEMDIDSNNMPDQWNSMNKSVIDANLENGIFNVNRKDINKNPYIYTRDLDFEPDREYLIEVELSNQQDIASIPFMVNGVTDKIYKLRPKNGIFAAKFTTPSKVGDKNQLRLYVQGNYSIKNVRIISQ